MFLNNLQNIVLLIINKKIIRKKKIKNWLYNGYLQNSIELMDFINLKLDHQNQFIF